MRTPMSRLRAHRARGGRRGFSLIEIVVAIVLLGIALSSLGVLAFQASRNDRTVAASAFRAAAMNQLVGRYQSMDFDSLANAALDQNITTGQMPHRLQATVLTTAIANERRVRLIVTPTDAMVRPETVTINRYRWALVNPLNMATAP